MPAIGKILIVFISMLVLSRVRVPLGLALASGGIVLDLWAGLPGSETMVNLVQSLVDPELWLLLVITMMIIEMGRYLTEKDNAAEIITAVQSWGGRHGRAVALMSMPAVIGLIPMPAGALFSAPFVQQAGGDDDVTPEWKSAVNYWFRHVWEYWWPLYPGVIVAMQAFDMVETWKFLLVQVPFSVVAIGAGYFFLIRPHKTLLSVENAGKKLDSRRVVYIFSPVLVVVIAVVFLPLGLKLLAPDLNGAFSKLFAMAVGLLIAIGMIIYEERKRHSRSVNAETSRKRVFSTLFEKKSVSVMLSLVGILVFKFMLGRSGLLPQASGELLDSGIPLVLVVAVLPFLAGMVTGIALAFVGASFPLVVGLMTAAGEGAGLSTLATLTLAFGFGYMGMILSPVHLCLLVTKDYFDASMRKVYMQIAPCVLAVLIWASCFYLVLRFAGL